MLGKMRNPTIATTATATRVTTSASGFISGFFTAASTGAPFWAGATEIPPATVLPLATGLALAAGLPLAAGATEFPLASALSLRARSAACWAAYAWTLRRAHSPGRRGSRAAKLL